MPGPYFSETLVDCPQTDAGGKTSLCQSFEREREREREKRGDKVGEAVEHFLPCYSKKMYQVRV